MPDNHYFTIIQTGKHWWQRARSQKICVQCSCGVHAHVEGLKMMMKETDKKMCPIDDLTLRQSFIGKREVL